VRAFNETGRDGADRTRSYAWKKKAGMHSHENEFAKGSSFKKEETTRGGGGDGHTHNRVQIRRELPLLIGKKRGGCDDC